MSGIAKKFGEEQSHNVHQFKTRAFSAAKQILNWARGVAAEAQLPIVRSALFLLYTAKHEQPWDFDYLEKVIDVHLADFVRERSEITDAFEWLSKDELNARRQSLRKRTMRMPLAKLNRDQEKFFKQIGTNRYAYDFAIGQAIQNQSKTNELETASQRNLRRRIKIVEDIVKDSDRSRPWDE